MAAIPASSVRFVPSGVPQANPYPTAKNNCYFVRECYEECYAKLLSAVASGYTLINVTGTPGIGKSVFYLYVLQQFQEERHAIEKIVTASYDDRKEIERKIWIRGENDNSHLYRSPIGNDEEDCKYYLYDGVPDHPPPAGRIMICFSSPDAKWLSKLRKRPMEYADCYLPGWTFGELCTANEALGWKISDEKLVHRWKQFGGTARFILGNDDVETYGMAELQESLTKIRSLDDVLDVFENNGGYSEEVVHSLLHFDVKRIRVLTVDEFPELIPATDYIGYKIYQQLNTQLINERNKWIKWLDRRGKPAAFLDWLFTNYAHEVLLGGRKLWLRDLRCDVVSGLTLLETQVPCQRFFASLSLSQAGLESSQSPVSRYLQCIDGYKLQNDTLWLFQITRSVACAMHSVEILDLLKHLKILELFLTGTTALKLVFIVPPQLNATFLQQEYGTAKIYQSNLSLDEIYKFGCHCVPGIGTKKKRKLQKFGINTVKDLLDAYDANAAPVSLFRKTIEGFKTLLEARHALAEIEKIPQYVAVLDYRFELH